MIPSSKSIQATDVVNSVLVASRTMQEVAKLLRSSEENTQLKIFFLELRAHCAIIGDYAYRVSTSITPTRPEPFTKVLGYLENLITPAILQVELQQSMPFKESSRLRIFCQVWGQLHGARSQDTTLQFIRRCINVDGDIAACDNLIFELSQIEDDLKILFPEDQSLWTADELPSRSKSREPSYGIYNAAKSIYKALASCQCCPHSPQHELRARLYLGTYRQPAVDYQGDAGGRELDGLVDFEMFLSMQEDWHETRIRAAKEALVKWADRCDGSNQVAKQPKSSKAAPMKVRKLCETIDKMRARAAYRLELKVARGQIFKLQSERSNCLIDKTKDPIPLEYFLRRGSRAFTERTRRILAVILSSAVLHLHDTPWLQPSWNSSHVFFFRTTSSAVPLRPFIQTPLSHASSENKQDDTNSEDTSSDDMDPDDQDPDDLITHHVPSLITLAIMLMEVYLVAPFSFLAQRFGIHLDEESPSTMSRTRFLDADLVFQQCKSEIPENSYFYYALEKCMDPSVWEDEYGNRLADGVLRSKIYEEVVWPLETELSQAYSSISIDDLDRFAQALDVASWDQIIPSGHDQAKTTGLASSPDSRATPSPSHWSLSPFGPPQNLSCVPMHLRSPDGSNQSTIAAQDSRFSAMGSQGYTMETDYYSTSRVRFFDDELIAEVHLQEACFRYTDWRSKYQDVYDKFVATRPRDISRTKAVRIAVLDTGIDLTHPDVEARLENIKGKYNWTDINRPNAVHDRNGHGTFTAGLILDYAPDSELYVAKIADNRPSTPKLIAKAINHAVLTWQVDIISMSFGFPTCSIEGYEEIESAIMNAYNKRVLLFAAASNSGGKLGRSFPARDSNVIAVHSVDANGNRSDFSPTATGETVNFAAVGEAVESAWPVALCDELANPMSVKRKSGTSYATPIAASIAAFLLLYVRLNLPEKADILKRRQRMEMVLKRVAQKGNGYEPRDGYHFLDFSLFGDSLFGKDKTFIDATLEDLLSH